jgi:ABC-type transport system involved in multi-copper enzyme maturation permease subunit
MSPMKSIFWKEVRQQGVIMAAMLGLAVMVLGMAVWGLNLNSGTADKANNLNFVMFVAVSMTALYAVASAATTYAAEREDRTLGALEALPLVSRQLWFGKVGVAAGLALLFLLLMALAILVIGRLNPIAVGLPDSVSLVDLSRILAISEYFLWALLFSLLLSRPLVAATLGIVVPPLVTAVCSMVTRTMQGFELEGFTSSGGNIGHILDQMTESVVNGSVFSTNPLLLGIRCAIIVGLAIATTRLGWRWLDSRTDSQLHFGSRRRWKSAGAFPIRIVKAPFRIVSNRLPAFGRYFWLTLRTQWPLMLVWSLLPFVLLFALMMWIQQQEIIMACLVALGGVAGAMSFSPDKVANGQAFLGQRAEQPGLYFLANTLAWMAFIAIASAGVLLTLLIAAGAFSGDLIPANAFWADSSNNPWDSDTQKIVGLMTFASHVVMLGLGQIFCFSVGQFSSVIIRSRILAFVAASLVAGPFAVWYLLILASRTPFWYGVFPIMLAFLIAGWQATRWWMGGGIETSRAIASCSILALFVGALGWAIASWRRCEIPMVSTHVADYRTDGALTPDRQQLDGARSMIAETMPGPRRRRKGNATEATALNPERLLREARARLAETMPGPVTDMELDIPLSQLVTQRKLELDLAYGLPRDPHLYDPSESLQIQNVQSRFDTLLDQQSGKIEAFRSALELGVGCLRAIELMEPEFVDKARETADSRPILPFSVGGVESLLCYEFLRAVQQKEKQKLWPALKAILSLHLIHDRIYGSDHSDHFQFEVASYVEIWLRSGLLNPGHVEEAVTFIHDHLPNHSFMVKRGLERDYLQTRQAIVTNSWISERGSEMEKQMLLAAFGFEKERSLRLLDVSTNNQLQHCWYPEIKALSSDQYSIEYRELMAKFDNRAPGGLELTRLASNTIVPAIDNELTRTLLLRHDPNRRLRRWDRIELSNRRIELAMLSLAAVSFQFKQGRMPESLAELVGDKMPRLPKSRYAPVKEGLDEVEPDFVFGKVWENGKQVDTVRERVSRNRTILVATVPIVGDFGN